MAAPWLLSRWTPLNWVQSTETSAGTKIHG
jgi:hypothetical protein